jgi:hypothetical protein
MRATIGYLTTALALALILSAGPATAGGDLTGTRGSIAALELYTLQSDAYLAHHGKLFVVDADKVLTEYRWGGISCGSRVLTDAQFEALHRAVDNKKMMIEPTYQLGQGDAKCVVGFSLVPKKYLKLFP